MTRIGPTPLPELIDDGQVANHRELFCHRYDACLGEAIRGGWVSWTCACCAGFEFRRARLALGQAEPLAV